ncbi:hypothetical protein BJ742DRAFT_852330 [Cladochytrium replicatum]|nr:hypothetical protein BJ742DRAFT_852330 [Cladochytrium replicatum]
MTSTSAALAAVPLNPIECCVLVHGLDNSLSLKELQALFQRFGSLVAVSLFAPQNDFKTAPALLHFNSQDAADSVKAAIRSNSLVPPLFSAPESQSAQSHPIDIAHSPTSPTSATQSLLSLQLRRSPPPTDDDSLTPVGPSTPLASRISPARVAAALQRHQFVPQRETPHSTVHRIVNDFNAIAETQRDINATAAAAAAGGPQRRIPSGTPPRISTGTKLPTAQQLPPPYPQQQQQESPGYIEPFTRSKQLFRSLSSAFRSGFILYIPWVPMTMTASDLRSTVYRAATRTSTAVIGEHDIDCRVFTRPETNTSFAMVAASDRGVAVASIQRLRRMLWRQGASPMPTPLPTPTIATSGGDMIAAAMQNMHHQQQQGPHRFRRHNSGFFGALRPLSTISGSLPQQNEEMFSPKALTAASGYVNESPGSVVSVGRRVEIIPCFSVEMNWNDDDMRSETGSSIAPSRSSSTGSFKLLPSRQHSNSSLASVEILEDEEEDEEGVMAEYAEPEDDEEEQMPTSVRISGLPANVKLTSVVELVSAFGDVVESKIKHVMSTPIPVRPLMFGDASDAAIVPDSKRARFSLASEPNSDDDGGMDEDHIRERRTSLQGRISEVVRRRMTEGAAELERMESSVSDDVGELSSVRRRFTFTSASLANEELRNHSEVTKGMTFREFAQRRHSPRTSFGPAASAYMQGDGGPVVHHRDPRFASYSSLQSLNGSYFFPTMGGSESVPGTPGGLGGGVGGMAVVMRSELAAVAHVTFSTSRQAAMAVVGLGGAKVGVEVGEGEGEMGGGGAGWRKVDAKVFCEIELE